MAAALRGFGLLAVANIIGQVLGFAALVIVARRIGARRSETTTSLWRSHRTLASWQAVASATWRHAT